MKIINIKDTREYEEGINDKWVPIPGSGITNECERCGKDHEVHVLVQDEEKTFVVGTGCARTDDMITAKQEKAAVSTAKTLAKWEAIITDLTPKVQEWNKIYDEEVKKMETANGGHINLFRLQNKISNEVRSRMEIGLISDDWVWRVEGAEKPENTPKQKMEKAVRARDRAEAKIKKIINN